LCQVVTEIERCEECGVPVLIGEELRWEDGGVISMAQSPGNRMVIYESNIIDNVFRGVEELTGEPIELLAIESRRRETRRFIERSFPFEVRNTLLIGEPDRDDQSTQAGRMLYQSVQRIRKDLSERVINYARTFGYGDVAMDWESGEPYPWRKLVIRNPYSLSLWKADVLGTVEAFEGVDMCVESEEMGDDVFQVRVSPGEHPVALRERLGRRKGYEFKEGDIAYEMCATCGIPKDIAGYEWDLARGTITAKDTGRRVAIFGSLAVDAVLDDVVAEHGPAVEQAVIEAQRRFVKARVDASQAREVAASLKFYLARRGLGYLSELQADARSMSAKVTNACLHLLMVGMAQAFFELILEKESAAPQWELSEDGVLHIAIQAK